MVWQAFFDDSGGRGHSPVLVLGGLIAPYLPAWKAFTEEWQQVLDMKPSIAYFKMNEAAGLGGQFIGWDPVIRDEKVRAFYKTIERNVAFQASVIIDLDAFRKVAAEYPFLNDNPHYLAFSGVVAGVVRNQTALGITGHIDFIFDEQAREKPEIMNAWDWYKSIAIGEQKGLLGNTPAFADDKKVLPLQAANLVAWWIRKMASERQQLTFPWTSSRQIPGVQIHYTEERIRSFCETLLAAIAVSGTPPP
jgi:hypothetical protein